MTRLISIFGDSISTFEGMHPADYAVYYMGAHQGETGVDQLEKTWWMQVIDGLGAELCDNAAWSGSMVEGDGYPAGDSPERVAHLARSGRTPDDIIIYYGINDYGWGSVAAEQLGKPDAAPMPLDEFGIPLPRPEAGLAPLDAVVRFTAAYTHMLALIRSAYPDAHIWCISLVPGRIRGAKTSTFTSVFRGAAFIDYNRAIAAAADTVGATFCNAAALGYDYEGVEGTHPTALGMQQLAWLVLTCMQQAGEQLAKPLEAYPGGEEFISTNPCEEPGRTCVGCPKAMATGNKWRHVCQARM